MVAPLVGQLVFVVRPAGFPLGWDAGLVLANVSSGTYPPAGATFYTVSALVFSTPADNGVVAATTVPVNVYPDRVTATTFRSGSVEQVRAGSVT
jgi:hypothetical protein